MCWKVLTTLAVHLALTALSWLFVYKFVEKQSDTTFPAKLLNCTTMYQKLQCSLEESLTIGHLNQTYNSVRRSVNDLN